MDKIYILTESSGEYDDYRCSNLVAYKNKASAEKHLEKLKAKLKKNLEKLEKLESIADSIARSLPKGEQAYEKACNKIYAFLDMNTFGYDIKTYHYSIQELDFVE